MRKERDSSSRAMNGQMLTENQSQVGDARIRNMKGINCMVGRKTHKNARLSSMHMRVHKGGGTDKTQNPFFRWEYSWPDTAQERYEITEVAEDRARSWSREIDPLVVVAAAAAVPVAAADSHSSGHLACIGG